MAAVPPGEPDYDYRPMPSAETGDQVRMYSQESAGAHVVKAGTSRVGTDGLREALKSKYGVKPG